MIIGIPMSVSKTQYYINQAYVDYVKEAGFEPLAISPKSDVDMLVAICEGLLLPGGVDIDPIYYGLSNYSSISVEPAKDMFERKLLHAFIAEGKPIFGICRGLQLIARELMSGFDLNGRLRFHQHIDDHAINNDLHLARSIPAHAVDARKGVLYGKSHPAKYTRLFVNSLHHQCLSYAYTKSVGRNTDADTTNIEEENNVLSGLAFEILARTTYGLEKKDKFIIVEAFRLMWGKSRILAVQWHPEELKDLPLLENFFSHKEAGVQISEMEV